MSHPSHPPSILLPCSIERMDEVDDEHQRVSPSMPGFPPFPLPGPSLGYFYFQSREICIDRHLGESGSKFWAGQAAISQNTPFPEHRIVVKSMMRFRSTPPHLAWHSVFPAEVQGNRGCSTSRITATSADAPVMPPRDAGRENGL